MRLANPPENGEGKGLNRLFGWVGDQGRPRYCGVEYRAQARKPGVLLNFCPWCGERILPDEPKTAEASTAS